MIEGTWLTPLRGNVASHFLPRNREGKRAICSYVFLDVSNRMYRKGDKKCRACEEAVSFEQRRETFVAAASGGKGKTSQMSRWTTQMKH